MPGAITGPRAPGAETISVPERGGFCPHGLASDPRGPGKTSPPAPLPQRPCTRGPSPSLAFMQIESELEVLSTPERVFLHCIDGGRVHPRAPGSHWQRWDENTLKPVSPPRRPRSLPTAPRPTPASSASLEFLTAESSHPVSAICGSQAPQETSQWQQVPKTRKNTCRQVLRALYQPKAFALCSLGGGPKIPPYPCPQAGLRIAICGKSTGLREVLTAEGIGERSQGQISASLSHLGPAKLCTLPNPSLVGRPGQIF